jgi:hypothetical protein
MSKLRIPAGLDGVGLGPQGAGLGSIHPDQVRWQPPVTRREEGY